ncbi:hypothetical protein DM02DRAFT_686342, partial [Periconia macrospinosa]
LLHSSDYSDMTVTCGKSTYKVHKAIVCPQVPFFAGAVSFKEKQLMYLQNGNSANVDLSEDDPDAVEALIHYLYKADYAPCLVTEKAEEHTCGWKTGFEHDACIHHRCSPTTCAFKCRDRVCDLCFPAGYIDGSAPADLQLHIKVYQLADMYQIDNLKILAKHKLQIACRMFWDTEEFVSAARLAVDVDMAVGSVFCHTVAYRQVLLKKKGIASMLEENRTLAMYILRLRADDLIDSKL